MTTSAPQPVAVRGVVLRPGDDVAVATSALRAGGVLLVDDTEITVTAAVPAGHKVALREVAPGQSVRKYGQAIGRATRAIANGDHVHVHNLTYDPSARDATASASNWTPAPVHATFEGYRRSDGRVGTRNYIGILTSVNCSASTANLIVRAVETSGLLDAHPHVDGVVALTHQSGCGMVPDSPGGLLLQRTLRGYAEHPNFGGLVVLGLGCEMIPALSLAHGLDRDDLVIETLEIQPTGGIRATVRRALAVIEAMLPRVDAARRTTQDARHLVLGLKCGGSDGLSGVTANPALGVASDLLISAGGTSILAETPEIFGAEHLLLARATSDEVRADLRARLEWWQSYMAAGHGTLDTNPSPGNKAGGLTTILEKSLGAVAKSGTAPLTRVLSYAERADAPGLHFMDTPGYDPVSVTGMIGGGATVVVFTTGRGSVFGSAPTPTIKVATNDALQASMGEDIDFNAGGVVSRGEAVSSTGAHLFDLILEVASGRRTAGEELRLGQEEFVPWHIGAVT